ncbi:short-chain dehydrogenase/reductase-like protein [Cercophora scortea]|uniref:Short-chain dehydrogenase/reductase-like protein n=1 Tax=Cercophora scortea TaxID=314031 RepID=A0AAE0MCZ6_9PEZI|nr:short-chain dehydrogenase/reductase-like protein [Cercophora scortea]
MSNLPPGFLTELVTGQFRTLPVPTTDYTGKTIIVTGGSGGIGLECARHFTRLGAQKVVIACRNTEQGEAAKQDIETSTSTREVVEVWPLDLTSFESVKAFCRRADTTLDRLDVLLENAGVFVSEFALLAEAEGHETTVTVNVLSTFLMAVLLLPKLRATAARFNVTPHLTIVGSDAHYYAKFPERNEPNIFEALKRSTPDALVERYNVSKLLSVLLTRQLAQRCLATGNAAVVINTANPGFCRSKLFRNLPGVLDVVARTLMFLFARTNEMGARALLAAADGPHGAFVMNCKVVQPSLFVTSEEGERVGERLWDELVGILEVVEPGVTGNI